MIAKTTIGADFLGAICYGAGLRVNGKEIEGKSELLLTHNLVSGDPKGMALEMQREAEFSRCKKPVWHTSLSWKPGENPSKEQMIEAANRYCEKMGANPEDHQIVVFQHHDRPYRHIHVYFNRAPVGGGKALETSHNYARNVRVCKGISQELGFATLNKREIGNLRHVADHRREAQRVINLAVKDALKHKCVTPFDVERLLEEKGIQCKFTVYDGELKYSSYIFQGVPLSGQDVGFTAKQLQKQLDRNALVLMAPNASNHSKAMKIRNSRGHGLE
ncbi:relaxase/mobilization nuclease domain-containing protein [Dyadobacter aurulentus]|uniref:relaxase/mobilization nuclease domain-containing protein n=1 Tax=Dyadobacter sp. UC 10 TaxID=2605428 RepID=UPI0011F18908|nr:relaxase/mobilization nuclease domain-containing protein [Dyadobacter sp. UC 10]KAA0990410.1 relaxase/mobilization nuclease domain-containing protein [Dyadobacter sp. UC 10]